MRAARLAVAAAVLAAAATGDSDARRRADARTPTVALVTRTHAGARPALLNALNCFITVLPGSDVQLVYVLDDESPADRALGAEILQQFAEVADVDVRVKYEPPPPCADQLFAGKLEGGKGKDRSQRFNFVADRFADADVVGHFDAEACFVAPVDPAYVTRGGRARGPRGVAGRGEIVRGGGSRHRRGCHADRPWSRSRPSGGPRRCRGCYAVAADADRNAATQRIETRRRSDRRHGATPRR